MVENIEDIERFTNGYRAYLYVEDRGDHVVIKGTFDDLDPEPERTKVEETLSKMRRDIDWNNDFPLPVEKVSDIESRYGNKFIRVYPED